MSKAIDMIISSARAGANCVKFQMYKADELAIADSPAYWDTSKEKIKSQHSLFSKFDSFNLDEYKKLAEICKEYDIEFMVTPFSREGVNIAKSFCNRLKIASADITNYPLLEEAAKTDLPLILSTGAAKYGEIQQAISLVSKYNTKKITLLHCVLNYPTKLENAYLKRIVELKDRFPNCNIGYSDHVPPNESNLTLLLSLICGSEVIEKHYTYDKTIPGNDHYHAFDEDDLMRFYNSIDEYNNLLGEEFDEDVFIAIQQSAILNARRSIVAKTNIVKGEKFSKENLDTKRPGTGIPASRWYEIIGKTAAGPISLDSQINDSDIV